MARLNLNLMAVIISALVGLFFMTVSLFWENIHEKRSQQLYAMLCFLFGVLVCASEMAFVGA